MTTKDFLSFVKLGVGFFVIGFMMVMKGLLDNLAKAISQQRFEFDQNCILGTIVAILGFLIILVSNYQFSKNDRGDWHQGGGGGNNNDDNDIVPPNNPSAGIRISDQAFDELLDLTKETTDRELVGSR